MSQEEIDYINKTQETVEFWWDNPRGIGLVTGWLHHDFKFDFVEFMEGTIRYMSQNQEKREQSQ